jgi:hypothetical protein
MQDFAEECVTVFCNLSGYENQKLKPALTPFLDESKDPVSIIAGETGEPELKKAGGAAKKRAKVKAKGVSQSASSASGRAVAQATSATANEDNEEPKGELSSISAKCLMKLMYMARFGRFDLLRAVGVLTTKIMKWDTRPSPTTP